MERNLGRSKQDSDLAGDGHAERVDKSRHKSLSRQKSVNVTFWMKDESGTLLFDMETKKSRLADEAGRKTLATWSKTDKPVAPLSPELQVLERLIGTWDTVEVAKPAEWTPKEVRTTSTSTRTWGVGQESCYGVVAKFGRQGGLVLAYLRPKTEGISALVVWLRGTHHQINMPVG